MFVVCYVFCNISFHPVISLPSINSTYSILKIFFSLWLCVCVCAQARACVCLCTREANMNTWGAWASSGKGQPHCLRLQQKQEKKCYISYLPVKFSTRAWKLSVCLFFDRRKWNNQLSIPESMNTWCKWVVLKTSPPLCLQRSSRFIRRLNYRVTLVELQELQNSEGRVLILFYWSSCFLRKTLYWTFICLFSLERSDKQRKKEKIRTVGAHTPCRHTLPITSWLLSESKVNHRSRQYLCQTLWPWRIDGRFVEPWQQSSVNPADEKSVFVFRTNWLVNSCMASSVIAEKKLPAQCR